MYWPLNPQFRQIIERALDEDVGSGDLTSALLVSQDATSRAVILAREAGVLAGLPVAEAVFKSLSDVTWQPHTVDGARVGCDETIAEISGNTRAILMGERVALNMLQRLSGIATMTKEFVEAVRGFTVTILDTRKTAPTLRVLDKYAVRVGGGFNHRFGLYDGILIKDNHIRSAGGVGHAVALARARRSPLVKIEVEVTAVPQIEEALEAGADIIMLDNMAVRELTEAVILIGGRAIVEASGGVTLANVRDIAATGVNWISIGALTHSVKAVNLSLEVLEG